MSMMSEITTESNVQTFVEEIERVLVENKDDERTCSALRKLGRFALTQFEWSTPDWAREYKKLFEDKNAC